MKSNKGRTSKRRIAISKNSSEACDWIPQHAPFKTEELSPALTSSFERVSLVNNAQTERVTLDFNLQFNTPSGKASPVYDRIAIVELKQNKSSASPLRNYLRGKNIRPNSVSKYCMGILLTGVETTFKQYKPKYSKFIKIYNEQS